MEQQLAFFLALAVGLIFGGLAVWLMLRTETHNSYAHAKAEMAAGHSVLVERLSGKDARIGDLTKDREQLKAEIAKQNAEISGLRAARAELEARITEADKAMEEKLDLVKQAEQAFANTFKALSQEALQSNNKTFLDLAKATLDKYQDGAQTDLASRQQAIDAVVKPLRESLTKVDAVMREMEKSHASESTMVAEQVKSLIEVQGMLRTETAKFINAFRVPAVRGRWGEIQLRRVVELAGMVPYCDFEEQTSVETDHGRRRPDMIIRLPNNRSVIVDAKVSLKAYLEAVDATDEQSRNTKLAEHASQIRAHLQKLGSKHYWDQLPTVPEFVVAFLPGEAFFSAALEQDPGLIEYGIDQKVILATPTTLIALLKSVAYGWRQEKLAQNAQQISTLGKVLYNRLRTFTKYLEDMRKNLQRTVESYNRAVGSLESRVLVSARRFKELGASARGDIAILEPIDNFPRSLQAVDQAVSRGTVTTEPDAVETIQPPGPPAPVSSDVLSEPETSDRDQPASEPVAPDQAGETTQAGATPDMAAAESAASKPAGETDGIGKAAEPGRDDESRSLGETPEETPDESPVNEPAVASESGDGRNEAGQVSKAAGPPDPSDASGEPAGSGQQPASQLDDATGPEQPAAEPETVLWKPVVEPGDGQQEVDPVPETVAGAQPAPAEEQPAAGVTTETQATGEAVAEADEPASAINFLSFVKTN